MAAADCPGPTPERFPDPKKSESALRRAGALPPSALPGISPSRGEIGKTLFHHFIRKG